LALLSAVWAANERVAFVCVCMEGVGIERA